MRCSIDARGPRPGRASAAPAFISCRRSGNCRFSRDARAEEYCERIISTTRDYERYRQLASSAFQEYASRLNWTAAARATRAVIEEAVVGPRAGP